MKKKMQNRLLCLLMGSVLLTGCGRNKAPDTPVLPEDPEKEAVQGEAPVETIPAAGKVFFLNDMPAAEQLWEEIAAVYTAETGVSVKVQTAGGKEYEQMLKSKMENTETPSLFLMNSLNGFQTWKDSCVDLKNTQLYGWLTDQRLAAEEEGRVLGIPYKIEGYGMIYNRTVMKRYLELPDKAVNISSVSEINSFETLKQVAEDMTEKKKRLGIEGVFASASFLTGQEGGWQAYLSNIPASDDWQEHTGNVPQENVLNYAEYFKKIFDLYIGNSVTRPELLRSKTAESPIAEFALGKAAMMLNGTGGWEQIRRIDGNLIAPEEVGFLPVYAGIPGEEKQGICIRNGNFFAVSKQASKEDQEASVAFVEWLFSSDKGKDYITNQMGFFAPFTTFSEDEKPKNPLAKEVDRYLSDPSVTSVVWNFPLLPGQAFQKELGTMLLQYAQGKMKWEKVAEEAAEIWKREQESVSRQ